MKTLALAARNLLRNIRRTALTVLAIAFGLTMMLLLVILNEGSYEAMLNGAIGQLAGHVVVQAPGWQEEHEPNLVVTDASAVSATLAQTFPDALIAPRIQLGGLLSSATNSVGAGLQGMDPAAEKDILDVPDKIVDGAWLEKGDARGIVIGRAMADSLEVEIGDKVVFLGQFGGDEVQSRLFRVRGIFQTGGAEMDGFLAFCDLAAAQDLLGMGDVAHQVTVHLADPHQSFVATDEARAVLHRDDVVVLSWKEAVPDMYQLIKVDRKTNDVMVGILGTIVAMGVLNTILMSVLERTREFGVMLSIGMKPGRVGALVLTEGLLLGITGAILGFAAAIAIGYSWVVHGIDYSFFMGSEAMEMGGVTLSTMMYGSFAWWRMSMYGIGAVVFSVLAAVWPAIHVARLRPVEALHHV